MATGATGQLGLALPVQGELSGTWGDTVNNGITQYTNIAIAGTLTLTGDGAVTLANTTGDASASNITSTLAGAGTVTAQFSTVRVSGTTTTKVVTGPSYSKSYLIDNASSYAVTFKASGQTGVSISPGEKVYVYYNATDYVKVGGGGITYGAVKTTTYTAVANDGVLTNTTSAAFTVNLPASPATGTQVFIADANGTWGTNNLTVGRNGSTIAGSATDLVCDINSVSIQFVYTGTTWDIFAQIGANDTAVVTLTGTQTLTNKTLTSPTITGTGTIAAATVTLSSTLAVTGVATLSSDAVVNGLTVGRGAGAVSTNTAVGASALGGGSQSGARNVAVGNQAMVTNTTGNDNTAVGQIALNLNTTGGRNTAIGSNALVANTTASQNTAVGVVALSSNTTGAFNTAVGDSSLSSNTTASENNAFGYYSLFTNTTGTGLSAFGNEALRRNTTGSSNSSFGNFSLVQNTTGANNTGIGYQALNANTTASYNASVGYQSGYANTTGQYNVFFGHQAGYTTTTATGNVFIGGYSGQTTTGAGNTFIGYASGYQVTSGTNNTIIGQYSGGGAPISATGSNYIVLSDGSANIRGVFDNNGTFLVGTTSDNGYGVALNPVGQRLTIGHNGTASGTVYSYFNYNASAIGSISQSGTTAVLYNVTSDQRLKENIQDADSASNLIDSLQVRKFDWKTDQTHQRYGFVAQELVTVAPEAVHQPADTEEMMAVDYSKLVPMLVKEVQSLRARVAQLEGN